MSEEFDDIQEEPLDEEQNLDEEQPFEGEAQATGKFSRLLGSDSRKFKLSGMFKDWFLDYSSYVILQRAVPHIVDGLKPVQRRVLHAMYKMDDGRYTKVANIVGQAMQYHPHGDQSILGALVQLGQKGYAIDCQGNWGNILTGDSNAAPRYIEARLSTAEIRSRPSSRSVSRSSSPRVPKASRWACSPASCRTTSTNSSTRPSPS